MILSPPPVPHVPPLHSPTRHHTRRPTPTFLRPLHPQRTAGVAALGRDVDTFTESSGYLFELSTSEAESLTDYNISKISSIYRSKPLIVIRRLLQIGNTLGKWVALRYIDSISDRSDLMFQVCAVAGKQAARIRSPLDRSEFWICCSRLIDSRSDRWDFRFMDRGRSYDFPKLLFVQVCAVSGKQAARIRSPLNRSNFWICDPRLIDSGSDRWDFRLEQSTGSYGLPKLLQFVLDYGKYMSLNYNGGIDRANEKEKVTNEFENSLIYSNMCVDIMEDGHSIVREKRSSYSFDPSGCNSGLSYQAKGNSRTSFFKKGRMMRKHLD